MRSTRIASSSLLGLAVLAALGCGGGGTPKSNPDGGASCPPGTIGCLPDRPSDAPDAGTDTQVAVFALNALLFDQTNSTPSWNDIGFDLDGIDTTATSGTSGCIPPSGTDAPPRDGTNGIDNVFGSKLWPTLAHLFGQFDDNVCCYAQKGRGTLLLRIAGWNGTPNDAHVSASLLNAVDGTTETSVAWDATTQGLVKASDGTQAAPPVWDPDKTHWYVDPVGVEPGAGLDSALQLDSNAYLRDGYLVMALDEAPISLFLGSAADVRLALSDGHLIAKLSADGMRLEQGALGGRMGFNALTGMVAGLIGDCAGSSATVDGLLPQFADVRSDGTNDPTFTCDAVSVGLPFKGIRAADAQLAPGDGNLCYPLAHCPGGVTSCDPTPGRVPEQCDPNNCVAGPGVCTSIVTGDPPNDCNHATWD